MSGAALQYVAAQGLLGGETFVRSLSSAAFGIVNFIGIGTPKLTLINSMQVSSRVVLGDFDAMYIVPGFTAELIMNFGLLGVAIGYAVLGYFCRIVDRSLARAHDPLILLMLYYVGCCLVFRVIPADSASIYFYTLYTGLPLLVCAALAHCLRKPRFGSTAHLKAMGSVSGAR
jgi:hypothetical protein